MTTDDRGEAGGRQGRPPARRGRADRRGRHGRGVRADRERRPGGEEGDQEGSRGQEGGRVPEGTRREEGTRGQEGRRREDHRGEDRRREEAPAKRTTAAARGCPAPNAEPAARGRTRRATAEPVVAPAPVAEADRWRPGGRCPEVKDEELRAVVEGWSHDPHGVLGAHQTRPAGWCGRCGPTRSPSPSSTRTAAATRPGSCTRRHLRGAPSRSSPATTASRSPTPTARAARTATPSTIRTAGCPPSASSTST